MATNVMIAIKVTKTGIRMSDKLNYRRMVGWHRGEDVNMLEALWRI